MSTQINTEMVDLDPAAAAFLTAYIEAKHKIKEWQEKADVAAEQVKFAMGDVNGKESVRWTTVESRRIDIKKLRELLPEEAVEQLEIATISRRFSIVSDDE